MLRHSGMSLSFPNNLEGADFTWTVGPNQRLEQMPRLWLELTHQVPAAPQMSRVEGETLPR